jgi:hypothetical protein
MSCNGSFAAQPEACSSITNEIVSVDIRNDGWTPAAIRLKPGDVVIVRASGAVKLAHTLIGQVSAKGLPNGSGRLDMKVGDGPVIPVGDRWVGAFHDPGPLKFRVNSERYQDNSGAYRVSVIVIPATALPAAVKFDAE